jgi:hypothetical protein
MSTAQKKVLMQEIYDRVAEHLLRQNSRAVSALGICRYRTEDGKKCAIGCLIGDESYSVDLESYSVRTSIVREALIKSIGVTAAAMPPVWFFGELQRVHDAYPADEWDTELEEFALDNDLVPYRLAGRIEKKDQSLP